MLSNPTLPAANLSSLTFPASDLKTGPADYDSLSRDEILAHARPFDPLSRYDEFEAKFPQVLRILEAGGVHPLNTPPLRSPYTGDIDSSSWTNTGEHNLAVMHVALQIAERFKNHGLLTDEDVLKIGERAGVHDSAKRYEKLRGIAAKAGKLEGSPYSASQYEALAEALRGTDIDPEVAGYLSHAGKETGHIVGNISYLTNLSFANLSLGA